MIDTVITKNLEEDSGLLKEIIKEYFYIDVTNKSRQRIYVNARKTYSRILKKKGIYSLAMIGWGIGKDHATVLHYLRVMESEMKFDFDWKMKDRACAEAFSKEGGFLIEAPEDALKVEIINLRKSIKEVTLDNENMKDRVRRDKRFNEVFNLIRSNCPFGKERELKEKLITLLNGLTNIKVFRR